MDQRLKLKLFRQLFRKEGEAGFSLIELVVVVSVLAVLSAIAIPTFSCFQRKAQATAALAAMKQIQTECEINKADTANAGTFALSNLNSYQIQSNGSNGCDGASGTGLISAIPSDTNVLPTFILASDSNELTYSFRGETGTNFTDCLGLICVNSNSNLVNESVLFGPDSGLSCRSAKTYSPKPFGSSIYWKGIGGADNYGDEIDITVQPVTISVGDKSWLIDDVQTKIKQFPVCGNGLVATSTCEATNPAFLEEQDRWIGNWNQRAIEIINESESELSAEVDPENPRKFKLYSSTGTQIDNIKVATDMRIDGIPIKYIGASKKRPYALIHLPHMSDSEKENNGYGDGLVNLSSNPIDENDNNQGQITTVCDGR
jgi:prepilin-type N-terminal cleavage/methylation domain-containing protein